MKTLICIILMLTVAPIVVATGLVCLDPKNWGGSPNLQNILAVTFFGLITIPLWITYLPSLILTPMIMEKISSHQLFYSMSLWKFIFISLMCGTICGVLILSPIIIAALSDPINIILNWIWVGAISGALTLTIISIVYRKMGSLE